MSEAEDAPCTNASPGCTWDLHMRGEVDADCQPIDQGGAGVEPANPKAMLAGTFAIYEDGRGGFVLVTDTTEYGERRNHIPAAMVKVVSGGGLIGSRLRGLFGGQ